MKDKLGFLGTDFTTEDVTKYVVAKLPGDENKYEIINILGDNRDYYPLGNVGFMDVHVYSKQGVNRTLALMNKKGLPVYTCEISHVNKDMTCEQAAQLYFDATELWEVQGQSLQEQDSSKKSVEKPSHEEFCFTVHAFDDKDDFWYGKINAPDDVSENDIISTFIVALNEMMSECADAEPKELLKMLSEMWQVEVKDHNHLSLALVENICFYEGWQWETLELSKEPEDTIQTGMHCIFSSDADTDPDLYPRNGETVTVIEVLDFSTAEALFLKRREKGYKIRYAGGYEAEVYKDELHLVEDTQSLTAEKTANTDGEF